MRGGSIEVNESFCASVFGLSRHLCLTHGQENCKPAFHRAPIIDCSGIVCEKKMERRRKFFLREGKFGLAGGGRKEEIEDTYVNNCLGLLR